MGRLIDALFAFSRTGRKELLKTTVDMNELINDVIRDSSVGDNNKKIEWNVHALPRREAVKSSNKMSAPVLRDLRDLIRCFSVVLYFVRVDFL